MIYLKVKTVFLCLTVILICSLIYSTLVERLSAGNVFVLLIAATLCGVLTHIERLESFSASLTGVKATLTKLNESIETAETLIALLRKLQLTYAKAVFSIVQDKDVAAPHDFRSLKQRDAIKAMVIHEAEKAGLNDTEIREILDSEKASVCSEYAAAILYFGHRNLNGADPNKFQAALNPLMNSYPSPDQLDAVLVDCDLHDGTTRAIVEDYRHYIQTGRQRRPEFWAGRAEWMRRYIGFDL
jgi:hypothetical protein